MTDLSLDTGWAVALAGALTWTAVFSLVQPPLRGLRNLGLLASYGLGLAMAVHLPWREAAGTWLAFGLAGGLVYFAYEVWTWSRQPTPREPLRWTTLLHGPLMWPVMIPEALEYVLAEMGLVKPPTPSGDDTPPAVSTSEHS